MNLGVFTLFLGDVLGDDRGSPGRSAGRVAEWQSASLSVPSGDTSTLPPAVLTSSSPVAISHEERGAPGSAFHRLALQPLAGAQTTL